MPFDDLMSSPRGQTGGMSSGNTYPVKRVRFAGKRVPILLQDVNGPCPLIALANVLFLRGKVDLPAGAGEVDAVRGPMGPGRELSWSWVEKTCPCRITDLLMPTLHCRIE